MPSPQRAVVRCKAVTKLLSKSPLSLPSMSGFFNICLLERVYSKRQINLQFTVTCAAAQTVETFAR